MEIDWNYPQVTDDIYRIHKDGLREILDNFKIKYAQEDTVIDLRPIVASIKSFTKNHRTEQAREVFKSLVIHQKYIEEDTLRIYPDLEKIQDFITKRTNLYDTPDLYETVERENKVEDYLTPKTTTEQIQNSVTTPEKMAENLPLISAGVYNGLTTENPNDFLDKYQIAAQSNRWTEKTRINLFPAHLAGIALAWYKHFTKQNQTDNWEVLKTNFIEAFTPIAQVHTLQVIMENKIQEFEQPALNYFLEILTLCRRYEPNIDDKKIITYVIQGLRPEICELVLNEKNDTLDQLQDNLRKVELKLTVQTQNREKYIRITNRAQRLTQTQKINDSGNFNEINEIKTDIKTLTNIVANLNIQSNKPTTSETNKETGYGRRENQGAERREGRQQTWTERGRSPGRSYPRREPPNFQRWNDRGRSPHYRDYSYTREDKRFNQQPQWAYSGERKTFHDRRRDRTPQGRPDNYQTQEWQPRRSVTFRANDTTPQRTGPAWRMDRRTTKFCTFCGRSNHFKWECEERRKQEFNGQKAYKFCKICKMTNHETENCFKRDNKGGYNKKNL